MFAVVAVASTLAFSARAAVVRSDGVGPVTTGMTLAQAEHALGAKMRIDDAQNPGGACVYAFRADGRDRGIGYMVVNGTVQRVDIQLKLEPDVRTAEGITGGSEPGAVQRVYGDRAKPDRTDYAGDDDLIVERSDGKAGLRFSFEDGRLAWIIAGNAPALTYSEGCL